MSDFELRVYRAYRVFSYLGIVLFERCGVCGFSSGRQRCAKISKQVAETPIFLVCEMPEVVAYLT